jgi:hypothetical protein
VTTYIISYDLARNFYMRMFRVGDYGDGYILIPHKDVSF